MLAALVISPTLWAADADFDEVASAWSVRGFGTLGVARSSSPDAGFVRDLSQPRGVDRRTSGRVDSSAGVQLNWRPAQSVEFVGQVVSRYHYDASFRVEPTLAFFKWDPGSRTSLRAGRIAADFLMLSDSRLVGYSYLPVRPSVDFFGPLFFSHIDGADATLTLPTASGTVRGKVFAGKSTQKVPYAQGIWDTGGSTVSGGILSYQNGPWQLRGSVAGIRFSSSHEFGGLTENLRIAGTTLGLPSAIAAADAISARNTQSTFYSLGVVYDEGPLQVQAMLNQIEHESAVFQNSRAAYVLAGYRLGSFTPYAGLSWVDSKYKNLKTGLPDGISPGLDALNQGFAAVMAASTMNQHTWTLGLRWDFQRNTALKLQWDAVRGKPESRFLVAQPSADWNGKTDVLSLSLDFIY